MFPWLGKRPIAEVQPPELLAVLRRIESRGALETSHRAMQNCGQVGTSRQGEIIRGLAHPRSKAGTADANEIAKAVARELRNLDTVTVPNDDGESV